MTRVDCGSTLTHRACQIEQVELNVLTAQLGRNDGNCVIDSEQREQSRRCMATLIMTAKLNDIDPQAAPSNASQLMRS